MSLLIAGSAVAQMSTPSQNLSLNLKTQNLLPLKKNPSSSPLNLKKPDSSSKPVIKNSQSMKAMGGVNGGGGDLRAMQFTKIAESIADLLLTGKNLPSELQQINVHDLRKAIRETSVESTNAILYLDSGETVSAKVKDAINYPKEKAIVFNREAWDLVIDGSHRSALVLHEFLGILRKDDRHYQYSSLIFGDPTMRMYFNNLPATQPIADGLDFDFEIKCSVGYQSQKADVIIGTRLGSDGNISEKTSLASRNIQENPGSADTLKVMIYDESDGDLLLFGIQPKDSKSIRIVLGWTKNSLAIFPDQVLLQQSVKITPNFEAELELTEPHVTVSCHRMTTLELTNEPFFGPVQP